MSSPGHSRSPGSAPPARRRRQLGSGVALDRQIVSKLEPRFGASLADVRVHADRDGGRLARAAGADAYAYGSDLVFAPGRYAPASAEGLELLAHELAHAVQQAGGSPAGPRPTVSAALAEAEADLAAAAVRHGGPLPPLSASPHGIQRKIQMRDVGKGEQSGFARLPELIDRLNKVSTGLTFTLGAGNLVQYAPKPGGTLSGFDRQMMEFIDGAALIPLRLTNRQGLLRSTPKGPFDAGVDADAWASGYVDIDDMLASDDLGFQVVLVHFLRERAVTKDYARRIGTLDDTSKEFERAHSQGVDAEVRLLRDFFGDPTINLLHDGGAGDVFRTYRNSRKDVIRAREARSKVRGLEPNIVDVKLHDGRVMTPQEYRDLLERERGSANGPGDFPTPGNPLDLPGRAPATAGARA